MRAGQLDKLFNPASVAVFGASDDGGSVGARVFTNLVAEGFSGPIVPINPKHTEVGGKRCYAGLADVGQQIDLAVVATPAATIADILQQCGDHGVHHAIVLSAGFGETGLEGKAREAELLDVGHRSGVQFLGPNCVGLVRPWLGLNATFLKTGAPAGELALVSQSGALCSAISDWAGPHHLGFSAIVSLGNSVDIDFGEVLTFLATDSKTRAILLYIEGIRDARSFLSGLRVAARLKPVIVLKAGRHAQGSKAASTHTGALIGSDDVFDAALERAGAVRAQTFGQLFSAAEILSAGRSAGGKKLGIITNGGGAGVLAADRAGDLHLELPPPSADTVRALEALLPSYWSRGNPIDILGDACPDTYREALKLCATDHNFDGLLVMLTPQAMTHAADVARAVVEALPLAAGKPVLACWMGESSVADARELLSQNGIPDFTTPEAAVEAFSYLARHELHRRLALEIPGPFSDLMTPDVDGARMIINAALSEDRSLLSDIESKAVLRAFRIPCNTTIAADSPARALIVAETVGFPVAMKIDSPQISHKSDIGGVRVNIMGASDVQTAFRELTADVHKARPDATILGVTVEPMAKVEDARELVVGIGRDPVFGPTVLFGAGGTMVEVWSDSAVSLPPLNEVLVNRLIDRTRVARLLKSFRNRAAVNRMAVINVLLRISDLACEFPEIEELDINPLIAGPGGVIAVDARITVRRPPASQGRYDHMAITPYPRHLERQEYLADGTPLTIRPIRPEDAESEQSFVRELSEEAKHFRFLYTLQELPPDMLARFTQIDYSREMALVAFTREGDKPVQQGVARYNINPDNTSCEFAIVVSDKRQHLGIGTMLMKALMDAARAQGLTVMEGKVLAANRAMLLLMAELGFTVATSDDEPDMCIVEQRL